MTTYTLTGGIAVYRNPNTDKITKVDLTGNKFEVVVPDGIKSFTYSVDPLPPGDETGGDETVDISIKFNTSRLNGESGAQNFEYSIFKVD